MNALSQHLNVIQQHVTSLLSSDLNEPQRTFVQHVANITTRLSQLADPIPDGEVALDTLVPTLGEAYGQQVVALYGYAKLMLESPASFDHAVPDDEQRQALQAIYEHGLTLSKWLTQVRDNAFQRRSELRKQTHSPFDLRDHLYTQTPIYRYWLRERAVTLAPTLEGDFAPVYVRPYHVGELLRHLVVTLGTDLIEYGTISLTLATEPQCIAVHIGCTGVQLSPEELSVLFEKNGRTLYREQLDVDEGYLTFIRDKGVGSTLVVHLPKVAR